MNKKIRYTIVLFILIMAFSGGAKANAGLFNWISNGDDNWDLGDVYETITVNKKTEPLNPSIQSNAVVESKNLITPKKTKTNVIKEYVITATAYSSTVDQTDDTPFITASGTYVRDGVVAANFLPFGTAIRIPDIFGDKIFIVEDRMNKRYFHRLDIWFPERQMAKEFGIKQIRIEIVS